MIRSLSLRWKLPLSLAGLVVGAVAGLLLAVTVQVERHTAEDVHNHFREQGRTFERLQQVRFRQLRQTAVLLAEAPYLKAAIETGDEGTVTGVIRDQLLPLLDVDPLLPDSALSIEFVTNPDSTGLVLVCDGRGRPLGQMASGPLPAFSVAERPGVARALEGAYPAHASLWRQGGRYFTVATVPVWSGGTLLGTLSYGHPVRAAEADQLARDLQSEVAFFVEHRLLASSFGPLAAGEARRLAEAIHAASYHVLVREAAATTEVQLRGERWLVYVTPMLAYGAGDGSPPAFYAIARSYTRALAPLRRLQWQVLGLGLVAVALALAVGLALTRRITRPITELVAGIGRMERGDYGHPVPVRSADELGLLTRTFNTLVVHLRERLEMLKFVSGATLDAVTGTRSGIEPGGGRRAVTVLFSDVRQFTRWSEKRPPEEVIDLLNAVLRVQAEVVERHGGDVDKFVGDELVAVFVGDGRNRRAVRAAIEMQQAVQALDAVRSAGLSVGIGINGGPVVMGAIGSATRMDYTVVGNHVNLGARVAAAAGEGQILITARVAEALERRLPLRALEPIRVKGVEAPVPVFEVGWEPSADREDAPAGTLTQPAPAPCAPSSS